MCSKEKSRGAGSLTAGGQWCYNGVAAGAVAAPDMPWAGKSREAFPLGDVDIIALI
jgi:hypothetical protein